MGLDSYVSRLSSKPPQPYGFEADRFNDPEVFYWRKASWIHAWMLKLKSWKSGGMDDHAYDDSVVELTSDDLDTLERHVNSAALYRKYDPTGEYWDHWRDQDQAFIAKARAELSDGHVLYYWFC